MNTVKVIYGGAAGTTAMTIFSYAVSESKNKNFREPQLLASMMSRLFLFTSKNTNRIAGWILHYLVGFFFATVYSLLLRKKVLDGSATSGICIGAISGVVGVLVWNETLKAHPTPPVIHRTRFYGQLMIAHIIFGFVTILLIRPKAKSPEKIKKSHAMHSIIC